VQQGGGKTALRIRVQPAEQACHNPRSLSGPSRVLRCPQGQEGDRRRTTGLVDGKQKVRRGDRHVQNRQDGIGVSPICQRQQHRFNHLRLP
jgi:hypothetical protein